MASSNGGDRIRKKNFIEACKKHFSSKMNLSHNELLRHKAETVTIGIHQMVNPIVASGGYLEPDGKESLRQMIFKMYFEAFDSHKGFSREELCALLAQIHMEIMIESLDADPAGTGSPDLIS